MPFGELMRFSVLANRLRVVAQEISNQYQHAQYQQAEKRKLLGLGSVVAGIPTCAAYGLMPAMTLVGFGAYQLHKAKQLENKAENIANLHQRLDPRYVPSFALPRPRPF
jgi:hypothetical protein